MSLALSFFLSNYFFSTPSETLRAGAVWCVAIFTEVHVVCLCCGLLGDLYFREALEQSLIAVLSCQMLLPVPHLTSDQEDAL